jgi:hypothetical protein
MSVRFLRAAAGLLLVACTSLTLAAPPAPQATASAAGVKQLRFSWNAVSGATGYELWFKPAVNGAPVRYFQLPGSQRSAINNISVHLLDWPNVRYWVNACDASGCTPSSELSVNNLRLDTIGMFMSPSQQAASKFGTEVAISGDGTTLAAAAPAEATDDPQLPKGSAYVYRKSGGAWVFQSAISFDVSRGGNLGRVDLALNGDGNVLAVGLPGDAPLGTVPRNAGGSVKVFRFVEGNGWRHDATIAQQTGFELFSSDQVELDALGTTLAVKTEIARSGVYIYTYDGAGSWSHTGTVFGHGNAPENGENCDHFALSADGKVIARTCSAFYPTDINFFEVYAAPGWGIRETIPQPAGRALVNALSADTTGDALAITSVSTSNTNDASVDIYRRTNGVYQREASLRRGAWETNAPPASGVSGFGAKGQFSGDGKLLAVSDASDHGAGTGALSPPLTAGTTATGAVYVFERRTAGWVLRRVVKPGRAGASYETGSFGSVFAFGDNGKALVVGQPAANNNAGVVWLY